MAKPELAVLVARWPRVENDGSVSETVRTYPVQFNPKEFTLEKQVQLAEINIPGLDAPLQQFVRGQAEKLNLELFFDSTEDGIGDNATPVTSMTDEIYQLSKVESTSHAPPIVTFCWNQHFPGDSLENGGGQLRNSFTGVVESVRQQFTMFSPEGVPLRAVVTLVLREYRTLDEQLDQLNLSSPTKTHAVVTQANDTLAILAHRYYRQQDEWRAIARQNDIDDPRRLDTGRFLSVPAIRNGRRL